MLLAHGVITDDQLRIALREQAHTAYPLGKQLLQLGFLTESTLRDVLSASTGTQSIDLSQTIADAEALALVPEAQARRHGLVPLYWNEADRQLTIAIADIYDIVALDRLHAALPGIQICPLLAGEGDIARALDQYYGFELSIEGILAEIETGRVDHRTLASNGQYDQPIVRLIDALMTDAVKRDASDIHFEPEAAFLRIRYRIDGILRQIRVLHKSCWAAMAVRIKVMAKLNIAETRAPQDGRISLTVRGYPVDFGVSSQPTLHGENIVLRILDRHKGIVPLEQLGLADPQLASLKAMIGRPEGIILFTGPTGSGKTTTLYSILNHINTEGINIMTLEDPVEYPMPSIRQTSVSEASKLDFANGIRAMMRQDPDVILVGEVRDAETAEMAFRAAMTGHQVYTTLHTSSAIGAIPRLLDLGIVPDILAGNIIGIVAQRLVRRLCPQCRCPRAPHPHEQKLIEQLAGWHGQPLFDAIGCPACDQQGYQGRLAIMELIRMDADLDELLAHRVTGRELLKAARTKGFHSLAEDGVRRVLDGQTTLEELARVVDLFGHGFDVCH
ncbi:MAG: secretion system protein E [Candidatus Dactylopiibacterium carminicum]|nr:MAG: secretion system protein E [Candidatus Dactylopiibacterium carminicum]